MTLVPIFSHLRFKVIKVNKILNPVFKAWVGEHRQVLLYFLAF